MFYANKFLIGIAIALSTSTVAKSDVTHTLRYNDAGREIDVKVGDTVAFVLPAYLGTGTYWTPRPDPIYKITQPPRVGDDPAKRLRDATNMRIQFIHPGRKALKVAAVPMSYGGGNASNVLTYNFIVSQ